MPPTTITNFRNLTLPSWVRGLLLDLDNTCYEYEPCHIHGLTAVRDALEALVGPIPDFLNRYTAAQKLVKGRIPTLAASHSRILYFQALLEALPHKTTATQCSALEQLYWEQFMKTMVPTEGIKRFLQEQRSNGVKVAIVSDLTTAIQCQKLDYLGLTPFIDALVTSEEVGAEKPNLRCFTLALQKISTTPENSVMIGDNPARDIDGAKALGITAILFTHEDQIPPKSLI